MDFALELFKKKIIYDFLYSLRLDLRVWGLVFVIYIYEKILCSTLAKQKYRDELKERRLRNAVDGRQKIMLLAIILLVVTILFTISDIKAYYEKDIVCVQGIYICEDKGRESRRTQGYTVRIIDDEQELKMSTLFQNRSMYPEGSYHATIYYSPKAKWLLHIENIEPLE